MDEEKRAARRKLLAEIERGWESPKPGSVRDVVSAPAAASEKLLAEPPIAASPVVPAPVVPAPIAASPVVPAPIAASPVVPAQPSAEEIAALDAAAARLLDQSDPAMGELDSGWGEEEDDEDDEDDEADDEDDVVEPELPDERLDPVAYAEAKKARDERVEARRQRKRAKAEAKKARRKARADAARGKQKAKTRKARPPAVAKAAKVAKAQAREEALAQAQARRAATGSASDEPEEDETGEEGTTRDVPGAPSPPRARAKLPPSRPMVARSFLSGPNAWMLAVAVVVFLAAAIFAAVIAR